MKKERQIKLLALFLALTLAIVGTVMILGIQVSFNQNDKNAKITAPIIAVGLVAILFIYKLIRKQTKTNFVLKMSEGKKLSPYFTIAFTYFDYMLLCGIISVVSGIASGILSKTYETVRLVALTNWAYTMSRLAIVFSLYILCFVVFTVGNLIAYAMTRKKSTGPEDKKDEGV